MSSLSKIILLLVTCLSFGCSKPREAPKASVPRITVAHPVSRTLTDESEFGGWLAASATVEVRARVRGHIDRVHFEDGKIVQKNEMLFSLDPRPFQAQIDQSKAQVRAFEAQKFAAEKDVARYTALLQSGGATKQQLEKAEADVKVYEAQVAAQTEQMREHELNLEFAQVKSPIDGRIGRALLTDGNLVNAGGSDPLLTTVVAINPIYVYFNVDERSIQRWQKLHAPKDDSEPPKRKAFRDLKIPFRFGLDTDEGFPNEGILDFADNKVDSATGTVEVRGVVRNEELLFIPGERVKVRVPMGQPYQALVVPETAILSDQEKKYVLVLGKDNVVIRRDIKPGRLLDDAQRVVMLDKGESLTPDHWIITLGLQRARINFPVEPLDADGQPISGGSSAAVQPQPGKS